MSPTQSAAFAAFLATLTPVQRAALLDAAASAVSNAESRMSPSPARRAAALALEGHVLLVSVRDATSEAIDAPEAPWV